MVRAGHREVVGPRPLPPRRGSGAPPYWMAAACPRRAVLTCSPWRRPRILGHVGIHRPAYTLGIPPPAGNPFFVLSAHVWGLIPWAAGYAQRINLFAAPRVRSRRLLFLIGERWLRSVVPAVWPRRVPRWRRAVAPRRSPCGTSQSSTRRCTRSPPVDRADPLAHRALDDQPG